MNDKIEQPTGEAVDTLPEWLCQRFGLQAWAALSDYDRAYWQHEAGAVRRAVARGGFKEPSATAKRDLGTADGFAPDPRSQW